MEYMKDSNTIKNVSRVIDVVKIWLIQCVDGSVQLFVAKIVHRKIKMIDRTKKFGYS